MSSLKLILVDIKSEMCSAFEEYFAELPNVQVVQGRFETLPAYDCMVSAANSFGLMDGGIDAAIVNFFGNALMHRVQNYVLEHYLGEQPVGTSFIIETGHAKHPFLAHTPTMRVPMDISHTDNAYKAMWAMLIAVYHHNKTSNRPINVVACPDLGTGAGHVPYKESARQMSLAYKNYLNLPRFISWAYADNRQLEIRYGGDMGFKFPPDE